MDRAGRGHSVLAHLGPEPLAMGLMAEYFAAEMREETASRLMDNKLAIVGVGNITPASRCLPIVFTLTASS